MTLLVMLVDALLEFLLNLNSLATDFSRPFFSPGCFQLTLFICCRVFIDHIWSQQVYELIA